MNDWIWQMPKGSAMINGKIEFSSKPFITITSEHPPGAATCSDLYNLGFEVYIQPLKGYFEGYVTTYKMRDVK